ncbi:phage gene 29 protein family protein [Gordonia malaquae]|uniref:phage gene 29 protein family protein n=1 Tax=Gordonia malaquae TaxID=410332 RepID=UPI0030FE016B
MNEAERARAADELTALFVGLPGVVGAPMVMGEGYWRDVAEHLLELGVRIVADPIKHYQVGESIDRSEAAGRYIYDEDVTPPQSPAEKYAAIADEQQRELEEKVAAMRAAGTLPKAGASPSERAAHRQRRAAQAESKAFKAEQRDRRAADTLKGSPLDGVGKPKRKGK